MLQYKLKSRVRNIFFCMTVLVCFISCKTEARHRSFSNVSFINIPLPAELENANQQFSGLCIAHNNLYLLPECRLQDMQEPAIYSIPLSSLDSSMGKKTSVLQYKKIPVQGLQYLRQKMEEKQQYYEGTEAMVIRDSDVYFSVETNTPSSHCYLLKGSLKNDEIVLDTSILFGLRKPTTITGEHIYNAGFESMMLHQNKLYCFFEYNKFSKGSFVYLVDPLLKNSNIDSMPIADLPFRITDVALADSSSATAINYFYKGEGGDTVYRPAGNDSSFKLVHDSSGYFNYSRLIHINVSSNRISWSVIAEMPSQFWSYNWEGLAAYKNGFFIINDKYTEKRPYKSVLLYVKP